MHTASEEQYEYYFLQHDYWKQFTIFAAVPLTLEKYPTRGVQISLLLRYWDHSSLVG